LAEVVLDHVTKYFGDVKALQDASLKVRDKELFVLVGPSGCGKSTTLRIIAGLEDPTEGRVYIAGKDVTSSPPKDRNIAKVFQSYALYPHMNVYDNLAFGLKLRHTPKREINQCVNEAATILGIKDLLQRKPQELSGGESQRVALGRAMVRNPAVFLMDEPLSNLDAKLRAHMRAELLKLHRRLGATIVYVTHDQLEAMTMGNRIGIMKDGIIQQVGSPAELYNYPTNIFVAGFIGNPSMNFLTVKVKGGGILPNEVTSKLLKLGYSPHRKVVLGIRPSDIYTMETKIGKDAICICMTGKVEVVEPVGPETYVMVTTSEAEIVARAEAQAKVSVGEEIELVFEKDKIHLFDLETEERIKMIFM